MNYNMKKKQYLHTNFIKFLVEKYNKEIQDEETDLPEDEIIDENEGSEKDENEEYFNRWVEQEASLISSINKWFK